LKLQYDETLSNFAVKFTLRRYDEVLCFEILWTILIVLDSQERILLDWENVDLMEGKRQGLTLVRFSAQLEPFLTQKTPYTPSAPPNTCLTRATQPLRAPPSPYKALKLS
jgi:hypothetical protein